MSSSDTGSCVARFFNSAACCCSETSESSSTFLSPAEKPLAAASAPPNTPNVSDSGFTCSVSTLPVAMSMPSRPCSMRRAVSPPEPLPGGAPPAEELGESLTRNAVTSAVFCAAHKRSDCAISPIFASAIACIWDMSVLSIFMECHRRWQSSRPRSERCSALCSRAFSALAASAVTRSASSSASRFVTWFLCLSRHLRCACKLACRCRLRRTSASMSWSSRSRPSSDPVLDARDARLDRAFLVPFFVSASFAPAPAAEDTPGGANAKDAACCWG
mmetsp:Transcript_10507/g.38937  ORF Transcript_10507/g.38937 Transcript_10507/m.38937 type:complete len:274 (-) Transcript_10507:552-1373(-)